MEKDPKDYEILGLPADAPRETVERKYGALLRSYKQRTDENGVTDEDVAYYQHITGAYDRIVGTVHDFSDPNPTSPIPFRVRNFFYKLSANLEHYKFLIVALLMVGVLAVILVFQLRNVRKDDLNIKFAGAFSSGQDAALIASVNEKADCVKAPAVTFFSVTSETTQNDQQAQNEAVQFRMQFLSGAIDVIFIDRDNFDVYLPELVFLDLTDFLQENSGKPGFEDLTLYSHENEGEDDRLPSGIYGIEFTERGGAYFSGMNLLWLNDYIEGQSRSMILTVCRTAQNPETALQYVKEILEKTA